METAADCLWPDFNARAGAVGDALAGVSTRMDLPMTPEELAELKRANDLQERQARALEAIAVKPAPRTFWQALCDDWERTVINSHRGC